MKPQTYFNTYSAATSYVHDAVENLGYDIDEQDWFTEVNMGGKPKPGETKCSRGITLLLNGKPIRKCLQIQVTNLGREFLEYELNWYIS